MHNPWKGEYRELKEEMGREEYVQKITDDYEEHLLKERMNDDLQNV